MAMHKKVCIIGAGVSGLRAAHKLLTAKDTLLLPSDVIILEAQARIGGRIKTDTTLSKLGLTYDLGAAWFHDALTNSVLYSSIEDGSFDVESDGYFNDKDMCYYAKEHPGRVDAAGLKLEQVVEDIEKFIEIHFLHSLGVPDVSLSEIVALYMKKQDCFLTAPQKQLCGRMCRYLELWYGISAHKMSGKHAVMSHQGRNLYNKKGYSFLVEKLQSQTKCTIMTSEQVTTIQRDISGQNFRHLVTTAAGTEIAADYLVVTVPQSILALDAEHSYGLTWDPPLPARIQQSLKTIHFGALGKVIFEFSEIWWDASEDAFEVLADENTGADVATASGLDISPFMYPIYVFNYATIQPSAASLVILTQSPVTEYLEAKPHLAWAYMKPMLAKISMQQICEPINTIVTDWTQNPYSRGSYSALHVGDDPSDAIIQLSGEYESCGLGISSTVRFAGEHTIADGAGCVHGAYDSGERAADWILKHLAENHQAKNAS
ncbi:amine oxidase [Metschnikowia bicuspidata var. bicuspidata NRRL YB-4993]|uniref:Amine oxidase n=1 Tax=Metschnikowia bicuspidata var. bicuspidata NRRL YB-4993 TaxID=869754 RepID=A0A1A0HGL4_9ASCO|nr:amine oxidase [Metschnikowia bicuspidata var. bicuspidata NRRL YB-4993]OBA22993.1 amine oxidase [Metschnikowia bicuspidata var. bicuspidata NRRL YB-4993]